jgi:transglutaminase-like putative cysteine protease
LAKHASNPMNFDRFFKLISYAVVFCGFLTLWVSGSFGIIITSLFISVMIGAWFCEKSRFQISERLGTALIFVIVPLFYIGWKYQLIGFASNDTVVAGILARLILGLSAIKLFQKKADRDWLFLYLMAFFEVLLAAALSISPLYLGSLILYLFVSVLAIIAFEIRKSSRTVDKNTDKKTFETNEALNQTPFGKLPTTAIALLFLIAAVAAPMFFMLPRVGGAGFGANQGGVTGLTGFSNTVKLGEIGRIQQSDEVVMRIRVEHDDKTAPGGIRWRGVALDTFDNKTWSKSKPLPQNPIIKSENDYFPVDNLREIKELKDLTVQTVYLEPLDTDVLFALPRPVAIQGNFPVLKKDSYGGIMSVRSNFERTSYKVYSDRSLPSVESLKNDNMLYSANDSNYLQIPEKFDERIGNLATQITKDKTNRYDKARAIEQYLQTQFGYTLEQKASGDEPLADFLFNVREGHCEYFATAMVMMLRTQGIAARVVNGFQHGEYNETADVYVVKQKDAHSWVEAYFPKERVWVTFDPTPFAGRNLSGNSSGMFGFLGKYLDALETFWIQYFVSFDNHEQQSLFRSMKNGLVDYQEKMSEWLNRYQDKIQNWWTEVRGDKGFQASVWALASGAGYLLAVITGFFIFRRLYRRIKKLELWKKLVDWWKRKKQRSIIEFYERMQRVLATKGFRREAHQTPLEFAFALGMPEAVSITEKYNRVRFGDKNLSGEEAREIEHWLESLEKNETKSS